MLNKTIPDDAVNFDIMPFPYEDEIDAALATDKRIDVYEENLDDVEIEEPDYEFDDTVIDSDDAGTEDATVEDYDAEEFAAAEKDLISNPFEDDEMIDAAIGNDEDRAALGVEMEAVCDFVTDGAVVDAVDDTIWQLAEVL
jgi:hypothetical protein